VIESIAQLVDRGVLNSAVHYHLHVVGIATEPGKSGKFLLWRHDRLPLPLALLQDPHLVDRLSFLIEKAEAVARDIHDRLRKVGQAFLSPDSGHPQARQPDPKDVANLANSLDAERPYWARLEGHFHHLLQRLPVETDAASDEWLEAVEREASRAFNDACDKLGASQRAIRARARVSDIFPALPRDAAAATAETEARR